MPVPDGCHEQAEPPDTSFGLSFLSPDNTLHRINGLTSPDQAEMWMAEVRSQLQKHQPRSGSPG